MVANRFLDKMFIWSFIRIWSQFIFAKFVAMVAYSNMVVYSVLKSIEGLIFLVQVSFVAHYHVTMTDSIRHPRGMFHGKGWGFHQILIFYYIFYAFFVSQFRIDLNLCVEIHTFNARSYA